MTESYWASYQRTRLNRRRVLGLTAGAAAAAALAACGGGSTGGSDSTGGGAQTEDTNVPLAPNQAMVNRFRNDLLTLDPAVIFGIEQEATAAAIYNGLTRFDVDTKLEADLAQGWETTADGLTWTWKLNPAKWQKEYGDVTSEDVAFSYNRVIQGNGSYAWEFNLVDSITASAPDTLTMKLKKPYPNLPFVVANYHQGQIVNRVSIDKLGDNAWREPVGTGPYIVSDNRPGQGFKFTRHEQYFKGPATAPTMEFRRIDSTSTAAIALQAGEIDTLMYVDEVIWDNLAADSKIKMTQAKNSYPQLWILNTSIPSLADPRIRQAINYAIDWTNVVATTTPHTQEAANSIVPSWVPDYSADIPKYNYDVKKAKELLSAAGSQNVGFKFLLSSSPSEAQQLTQAYVTAVGIKMEFEIADRSTFNSRRVTGDFEASSRGLPAAFLEEIMFNYLHPDNAAPKGFNAVRYNNPTLTAKMEDARSEMDAKKRTSLWADVQKIVMTDLPYIPATFTHQTWAARSEIVGLKVNEMASADWYPLKRAKV